MQSSVPLSLFLVVLAVALFAVVYSVYLSHSLDLCRLELYDAQDLLSMYMREYRSLSRDYNSLVERFDDLQREYTDLYDEYLDLYADYNLLVEEYGYRIDYIYRWLAANSVLPDDVFSREVSGCLHAGVLNYPCVVWRRGYRYIPDDGDHAKMVSQFIEDGGGDCEDWSFYAAALVRSLVLRGYRVRFFRRGQGRFFLSSRWYLPGAVPFELRPSAVEVVCGFMDANSVNEHCVIRVYDDQNHFVLVEPQSGEVLDSFYSVREVFAPGTVVVDGLDLGAWYRGVP